MATLTPTLKLASTDVTSDALSFTVTDTLTVGAPSVGLSKIAIAVTGGADTTIVASSTGNKYVFIKHTGLQADGSTATTQEVVIDFGTTDSIRINSGEFAWFPAKASTAITAVSAGNQTIVIEYAYWTKA
jgi:hypothetical protein